MMASHLDSLLAETLDDRAGGDIDPAPLIRAAVTRGRRIRRRRAFTCATALVAIAALGTAAIALPGQHRDGPPVAAEPGVPLTARPPMLPPATGQPGAAARPGLVGTDPRVLHFSVDAFAGTATQVEWVVEPGSERAEMTGEGYEALISVANSPADVFQSLTFSPPGGTFEARSDVRIGDRDGTVQESAARRDGLRLWSVRWQPATGVWAGADVWAQSRATAENIARLVSFDTAQRCALPFSVGYLPPGKTVRSCALNLSTDGETRYSVGALTVQGGRGEFRVRCAASTAEPIPGELVAGPYRVHNESAGAVLMMSVRPYLIDVQRMSLDDAATDAELLRVLGSIRVRPDIDHPATW